MEFCPRVPGYRALWILGKYLPTGGHGQFLTQLATVCMVSPNWCWSADWVLRSLTQAPVAPDLCCPGSSRDRGDCWQVEQSYGVPEFLAVGLWMSWSWFQPAGDQSQDPGALGLMPTQQWVREVLELMFAHKWVELSPGVVGSRAPGMLGLVPAHQWMGLGLGLSGGQVQVLG